MVCTDMPISTLKDEEKSRANEASSSSSAKAERIISGKPESRTNVVSSGIKVFSSFQVGKQHPKEEEYLTFTRYIYNLPEESGETYGVLGTTSLFLRISIFPNGLSSFTAQLFEFGYLDRVYTKPDLNEVSQSPTKLFEAVKNYAQGNGVYYSFFSISMECKDLQAYYPTLNYITIEKIKDFNVKAIGVIGQDHDWVLITKGRSKFTELKERILDIELHRLGATEETWKLACKMLDHYHP
ncbi:hypothetical protein H5410_052754 [Solanum commersonii]|uniref:Uncharacterized protein n=1 Tax=Solanum commersonii TaxID=4109 RepID=A0A9J5X337_SOLCO|nr:hypothetical protein H5410_052754 [Solanum commersonii]